MKRRNLQEEDDNEASEVSDGESKPGILHSSDYSYNRYCTSVMFFSAVQPLSNSEIIEVLSNSPTMEQMRNCFEALRRSLSRSKNPPVDEIIQSGLLGALVQALKVEVD